MIELMVIGVFILVWALIAMIFKHLSKFNNQEVYIVGTRCYLKHQESVSKAEGRCPNCECCRSIWVEKNSN